MLRIPAAIALALALAAAPALGGEVFAGVAAHDPDLGLGRSYEASTDAVAGVRSAPLASLWGAEVRGHLLFSVNTGDGLNFGALGASLRWPLGGGRFYVAPGLGAAVHDGPGDRFQRTRDRLYLGSRLLFEPELTLGARLSRHLAAELAYVHLSHATLGGKQNPGLDTFGVRLVYRFGE